ncbi:MAG: hypothetical protein IT307_14450 [Chloroflexi bacterium]|nr:hypothetical protein [Chloroflexota bacterium]
MQRFGRVLAILSWVTIVALLRLPWQQLGESLAFPSIAWASPPLAFSLPALLFGLAGGSAAPRVVNAARAGAPSCSTRVPRTSARGRR